MSRIELPAPATYVPVARSFLYRSLSLGFAPPTRHIHATLKSGRFMQELWDKLSLIAYLDPMLTERDPSIRRVSENMRSLSFEDFEASYILGFKAAVTPTKPSSKRVARECEETVDTTTAELRKCYEIFGLSTIEEDSPRAPDSHLPVKLEFLHYLTLKEFQAGSHRDRPTLLRLLKTQKDFLEQHLLSQLPAHLTRLRSSPGLPAVYTELAHIASEFVSRDVKWIMLRMAEESISAEIVPRRRERNVDIEC